MLAARLISALAALSMISTPIYAQKCTGEDYKAPYNLGETPAVIKVPSIAAPEGVYYLTPCITVNQGLCADSNNADQECYSYTGEDKKPHSESLGAPSNTTWSTSNWADEAVALNTDFTAAETNVLCDVSLPGGYFKTVYTCIVGDDTGVLASEPQRSTDACVFEIHVDSSVLCNYRKTLSSSSSSSSGESSSSSSSSDESSSSSSSSEVSSSSSSSSEESSSSSSSAVSSSSSSSEESSSSSAVSSSSSSSEESSSSSEVKSSSSSSSGLSSSSSGFMSSSSSGADDSSSSSSVVILSSSSSSSDDMSSTVDSTGDNWSSSSTGDADAGGLSLASQLGIGLGAGLGGLALILFCGLLFTCQKLRALQASKTPLLDEESQTGGRYSTIKSAEEGRGKKGNQRLV